MQTFAEIYDRAATRKGGPEMLEMLLPAPETIDISALTDDRILSQLSKRVFQAGFNWTVVDKKWPDIEQAFHGFEIGRNAMMSDEDLDAYLRDTRIIRHGAKILSVRDNAIFLSDLAREHGSAAAFFANWPSDELIGLWQAMKKRGTRLGGLTGQYALRFLGKDSFILSRSVVAALRQAGVIDGPATSQTALRKVQAAFNAWREESGESYTRMSRILALSVDV